MSAAARFRYHGRVRASLRFLRALALLTACGGDPGSHDTSATGTSSGAGSFGTGDTTGEATGEATGTSTAEPTTSASAGTSSASTSGGQSTGETGDETTGGPVMSEDEILLRKAIAGEVDPGEAVQTIRGRGGFPVAAASGGFLFACLCGQGDWTLAGDHNAWSPEPMDLAGPLWWIEAEVPQPDGSLYKFHEPGTMQWIADPQGRRYGFDANGRFSLVRASAAHLERWYAIDGADVGLVPRDLQVWVPQGGVFTHALYTHDGQNLFDPEAFWGGWHLQDSVPPGVLVVGIDNTPDRMEEYTHVVDVIDGQTYGGKGAAYAQLVDAVIRPRMEAAYGPAEVVGTMGSSLGGLISLVIADQYPTRYAMALSLSGTLGWGSIGENNETVLERYMKAGKREFSIYLDSGGGGTCVDADMDGIEDDDPNSADNYCENAQMLGILQGLGYALDADVFYVHDADAPHNEAAWGARVDVPLQIFAGI